MTTTKSPRVLLATLVVAALVGCSDDSPRDAGPVAAPTTASSTTTSTSPVTTTVLAAPATTVTTVPDREARLLADYRAAWNAYNQAAGKPDPNDPILPAHMTIEQVKTVKVYVEGLRLQGLVSRGTLDLRPRVASLGATDAIILDCYLDSTKNYDALTGELKDTPEPVRFSAEIRMVLDGSTWKMDRVVRQDEACAGS